MSRDPRAPFRSYADTPPSARSDRDLFQRFAREGIVSYLRAGKARRSIANKIALPTGVVCSTTMLVVDAFYRQVCFLLFWARDAPLPPRCHRAPMHTPCHRGHVASHREGH